MSVAGEGFSLPEHKTISCLESAEGRMLTRAALTIFTEGVGGGEGMTRFLLQSPKTESGGCWWFSSLLTKDTEKRKDRHSEAILHLGHDSVESTKRRHSGLPQ